MEMKRYIELQGVLTHYLAEKKLRKTEERYKIFQSICEFSGHFDMCMLHDKLEELNYHVSRATLYNTMEVLLACGLIVRHQWMMQTVQYELRHVAESHAHLVCTHCGSVRELKHNVHKVNSLPDKISRFTPAYQIAYIYGLCSKCNYRLKRNAKK